MDIISSTAPKILTSDKTFYNYFLTIYAYSKIPKLYGMEKNPTEEVMDNLDAFQSRLGNLWIWIVGSRKNFIRCRETIYLNGVQRKMLNLWILFDIRGSRISVNERTVWSYMENFANNCTITYGTCESFRIVYSFCINVYDISYFSSSTNKISDKQRWQTDHTI